ncbi:hypothetical protein SDC9_110625 [bioreactor metagenome]|uniref:Uncharacterized protein n=1 Tax=bioreactor metagenome TaxID=1076179 RepID=A0A645BKJ9_9ZZZZ
MLEKVSVVTDDHDGSLKAHQRIEQDLAALDVQVVGRFVEYQKVHRICEHAGKHDTALLPTTEHSDLLVHIITTEEEGPQHRPQHRDGSHGNTVRHFLKDGLVGIENVAGVLAEVPEVHTRAKTYNAFGRFRHAHNGLQQGTLSRTIHAGEGDLVAPHHRCTDTTENGKSPSPRKRPYLGEVFHHHHLVPASLAGCKLHLHQLGLRRKGDAIDLLQSLDARLHQGCVAGPGSELGDELLVLGKARLLAVEGGDELLTADLPLTQVEVIVAAVAGHLGIGHLDGAAADAGHELAVMAGHHQIALEGGEPILEVDDRLQIEVIRRFVHQEHIGHEGKYLGQGDAHLPSAAEGLHHLVMTICGDAKAGENLLTAADQVIPVTGEVFTLQLPIPIHIRITEIPLRIGHAVLQLLKFEPNLIDSP